ncbi:MAG: hypothetical protein Q8P57_01885 [Candidatus Pacearchaeota archaeon]|nr:hypothetical protein [Candidatus Pacearchaeota archaeon]
MKENSSSAIAATAIALMTSYFLSYSQFSLIKDIYNIGGTAFILLIPTVIAFFFIYSISINSFLRKAFWIFYGILSVYLLAKYNSLPIIITLTSLVLIIILILDNKIKSIFNTKENLKFHN